MTEREEPQVRVTNKRVLDPEGAAEARAEAPSAPEPAVEQPIAQGATDGSEDAPSNELARARAEAAQYLDDLKRLKAEFENYRKRVVKEQAALVERASAAMIERLLPVLDNFELALIAADRTKDYEAMVRGVELVYSELIEVLKKEGLERIDALHQTFDPERHEAVMRDDSDGEGDVIVVDEMRPGYTLGGRVIRPTMVKVGRK